MTEITQKDILEATVTIMASNPSGYNSGAFSHLYEEITRAVHGINEPETQKPTPAVNPKKSVHRDYIVCLEDGKKLKMLKRHLKTVYGLTPQQYREKWELPANYPMVSPEYAERRSGLAKTIGLGKKIKA